MDLLNIILNAGGGNAVRSLARSHGLDESQASSAITNLLPALSQGLARNAASAEGLGSLMGALSSGGHQRYIDRPESLEEQDTINDGNGILGHILGSKDVSRQVAGDAAARTGIGEGVLKKMLPVVAAMAMGVLSKQSSAVGPKEAGTAAVPGGLVGMLSQFLDTNKDGSVMDNVLGVASKLFNK